MSLLFPVTNLPPEAISSVIAQHDAYEGAPRSVIEHSLQESPINNLLPLAILYYFGFNSNIRQSIPKKTVPRTLGVGPNGFCCNFYLYYLVFFLRTYFRLGGMVLIVDMCIENKSRYNLLEKYFLQKNQFEKKYI